MRSVLCRSLQFVIVAGVFGVMLAASGCATVSVDGLAAGIVGGPQPDFDRTAHIFSVMGGREDSFWDNVGNISSTQFEAALTKSLEEANVFKGFAGENEADYIITATIENTDKPMAGLDMTVSMLVRYRIQNADRNVIWEEPIHSSYTAKMCSSCSNVYGASRLNNAVQGAARANLAQFVVKVKQMDL